MENVRLVLPLETLERLVTERRLSVNDFRCIDAGTKQRIRRMYLNKLKLQIAHQATPGGDYSPDERSGSDG